MSSIIYINSFKNSVGPGTIAGDAMTPFSLLDQLKKEWPVIKQAPRLSLRALLRLQWFGVLYHWLYKDSINRKNDYIKTLEDEVKNLQGRERQRDAETRVVGAAAITLRHKSKSRYVFVPDASGLTDSRCPLQSRATSQAFSMASRQRIRPPLRSSPSSS